MSNAIHHLAATTRRVAGRVGQIIAECNEANRRVATLAGTPDLYRAPDTYTEFLIRTAGMLPREPQRQHLSSSRGNGWLPR
jgi:hypothetical protein